jgi:hypothetical protein
MRLGEDNQQVAKYASEKSPLAIYACVKFGPSKIAPVASSRAGYLTDPLPWFDADVMY